MAKATKKNKAPKNNQVETQTEALVTQQGQAQLVEEVEAVEIKIAQLVGDEESASQAADEGTNESSNLGYGEPGASLHEYLSRVKATDRLVFIMGPRVKTAENEVNVHPLLICEEETKSDEWPDKLRFKDIPRGVFFYRVDSENLCQKVGKTSFLEYAVEGNVFKGSLNKNAKVFPASTTVRVHDCFTPEQLEEVFKAYKS